jgi:hypothetical protein
VSTGLGPTKPTSLWDRKTKEDSSKIPLCGGCRLQAPIRLRCLAWLTSTEFANRARGRDHHPRELGASGPRVDYKLARAPKPRRRPIIQSGFRSTNAACPLLHIDTLNTALPSSARKDDVDPVLHAPGYSSDGKQSARCHVKCGDVRILAPISGDGTCSSSSWRYLGLTSPAQSTLCSRLRSYRRSLKSYKITSERCLTATLKDTFGVIHQAGRSQLNSGPSHLAPESCSKRPWAR